MNFYFFDIFHMYFGVDPSMSIIVSIVFFPFLHNFVILGLDIFRCLK